jgi:hypothetical protein
MPIPVYVRIYINYQCDTPIPERDPDYLQEVMGVVEVHLFHADSSRRTENLLSETMDY